MNNTIAEWLREAAELEKTSGKAGLAVSCAMSEWDYRAAQVEAMTYDKMKLDIKAIENCVAMISGLSYHQGTFASNAHKYPDDFEDYDRRKGEQWKILRELLKRAQDGRGRGDR